MARAKPKPRPFFEARGVYDPAREAFVQAAVNLFHGADLVTGADADFPGKDELRKRVNEFRDAAFGGDEDA